MRLGEVAVPAATLIPFVLAVLCGFAAWRAYRARRRWLVALAATGVPFFLAATMGGMPVALTNAQLQMLPSYQWSAVLRLGVTKLGDAPPQWFSPSSTACSISGGDVGSQVPSIDGGCFNAITPGGPRDVREWGAPSDGVTNAGMAINACLAVSNNCLIPISKSGFYVDKSVSPIIVPAGKQLTGEFSAPSAPGPTAVNFAGQSWLLCSRTAGVACVATSVVSTQVSTVVRDLTIAGVSGSPAAGEIGLAVKTGYNITVNNVYSYNHDYCFSVIASGGGSGLGVDFLQPHDGACKTYNWYFDGWPEIRITGGRSGSNGGTDYPPVAWIFSTNTACGGGGCGPNTVQFVNHQFNPGGVNTETACALKFGNWTSGLNQASVYKFIGVHFESLAPGGSFICGDATVTSLDNFFFSETTFQSDSGIDTFFNLAPTTTLVGWHLSNVYFSNVNFNPNPGAGVVWTSMTITGSQLMGANGVGITLQGAGKLQGFYVVGSFLSGLTIQPASTGTLYDNHFIGDEIGTAATIDLSLAAGAQALVFSGTTFDNVLTITGNGSSNEDLIASGTEFFNNLTLSGSWRSLWVNGAVRGTLTNTATGNVVIQGPSIGLVASGGGAATKYVCVDAANKIVVQIAAC